MTVAGSDRVFSTALVIAKEYRTFTATEIDDVAKEVHGEDAPSRKTIYAHLDALVELGVLEEFGRSNTLRRFRFSKEFDPSQ